MATAVFTLCALTSIGCAVLLGRGWQSTRATLLLWAALSFAWLAVNNVLLVIDELVVPDHDLQAPRDLAGLVAIGVFLFGLIWSSTEERR